MSEGNLWRAVGNSGGTTMIFGDDGGRVNKSGRSRSEVNEVERTRGRMDGENGGQQNCDDLVRKMVDLSPRYFPNMTESLPLFDPVNGDIDIEQFVDKMEECGYLYNWDDTAIIHFALSRLKGNASCWRDSLPRDERSWTEWKGLLFENFPVTRSSIQSVLDAQNYRRKMGQSVIDYFYKKLALCNKARLNPDELVEWIVMGLDNNRFRDYLGPLSNYRTPAVLLTELVRAAEYIDANTSRVNNPKIVKEGSKDNKTMVCFKCREKGHLANQCPNKKKISCFVCHNEGHIARECPTRNSARNATTINNSRTNKGFELKSQVLRVESTNSHAKYFKIGQLNGRKINCYIDMGSSVTLIRQSDAAQLEIKWKGNCKTKVIGYGAAIVEPIGSFDGLLSIDGVEVEINILVVPDDAQTVPLIVGHQYTEQDHIRIISDSKGLTIQNGSILATDHTEPNKFTLKATESVTIPDNYVGYMNVNAEGREQELCIEGSMRSTGEIIPRCLIKLDDKGNARVPILNLSGSDMTINENEIITRGEVCMLGKIRDVNTDSESKIITKNQVHTELGEDEAEKLLKMLNEYRATIASNIDEIGRTNKAEMDIVVQDDIPIYYRPYRLAQSERDKVKEIVEELKDADIVEDSTSPYASPIILVQKRNGDIRLCIDYRRLNSKTVKDHFPLPLIDDQIDRLAGKVFFTSLDLASGYYQVPMSEKSKPKTAFVTPDGHYQFKRMPFGLCNAPAVFQRLINNVLGRFRYTIAMAYLDDIIIPSTTVDEGLANLETILKLIQDAGLTLNLSKCTFFARKIEYLGFQISIDGIEPGNRKLQCVENFPEPSNVKAVRSFIGLCSYFRRFIKNFASIAKPLTNLLKESVNFVWGDEQKKTFQQIKQMLMVKPILAIYEPNAKCEVHTDASAVGLGAVLYQYQNDESIKPVMYYSRKTSREESKYSAIELEALAIVTGLEKFRVYLLGKHFVVRTDCNSLKMLSNKRTMSPRIARWFLRVSEFDFTVEYMPGQVNQVADALSRYPVDEEDSGDSVVEIKECLGITITTDWVAALQRTDPEITSVRDKLEAGDQEVHNKFSMYNCRVYKYTKYRWRLYVPECLRYDVVRDAHEYVAHFGVDKTLARLKDSYYFPKMRDFVSKYVNRCIKCVYYKCPSGKKPGYLHPLEKGSEPFITVHIDHIGPYVATKSKNRYVAVIVDGYSKYVVLGAQIDVSSIQTLAILKLFISNYGRPRKIISDQGTAFKSGVFKEFCESQFIQHIMVASGCPRANGQVERVNRIVTEKLAMISSEAACEDWDEKIYEVQMAINNSVNRVTKKAPAELVFQYKFRSVGENPLTEEIEDVNKNLVIEKEDVNVPVLLQRNREIQEQQYNRKRKEAPILKSGDIVLVRSEAPAYGDSRKLLGKYRGPYEVIKAIGNDRYLIGDIEGEMQSQRIYKAIVAVDRLKLVKSREN